MRVVLLKEGKYCLDPAKGPVVSFENGDEYQVGDEIEDENLNSELCEFTKEHAQTLILAKWAKEIDSVEQKDEEDTEDEDETAILLNKLIKDIKTEKDQKLALQKWGKENVDFQPSLACKVETMIKQLCAKESEEE